jgi:hypothetical protein
VIAKGSGYVKGGRNTAAAHGRLIAHVKYIEYRSRELGETREDRAIFTKDQDAIDRKEAVDGIMGHTSNAVAYHKMVLSPGDDEPVNDWREWTRQVMADFEDARGQELHWFAVHHENTEHPHVHVVLAGAGENRETGEVEPVKMYAQDYQRLRELGHEHSEHDWYRSLETLVRDLDTHESVERQKERQQEEQRRDMGNRDMFER